jgi:hypothetical protein
MALVGCLWVGLGIPYSGATPPNEVKLSYDSALKVLHVNAEHPSDRLERHYLRTIVITQNGQQVKVMTLPRQTLARGLSVDIDLPAQGDDLINVELFCSQGGHGTGEIKLPPDVSGMFKSY